MPPTRNTTTRRERGIEMLIEPPTKNHLHNIRNIRCFFSRSASDDNRYRYLTWNHDFIEEFHGSGTVPVRCYGIHVGFLPIPSAGWCLYTCNMPRKLQSA